MRTALFTDIHANREALAACLAHARRTGFDRLVFLGDYVGYGADPEWAVEAVARCVEEGAVALLGNHDSAALGRPESMNEVAAAAMAWTRPRLSADHLRFLAERPLLLEEEDRLFVHASAHEPATWHYVLDAEEAALSFEATPLAQIYCGHVHRPALYHLSVTAKLARFVPVEGTPIPLSRHRRWLAVIGAVGQPRDGMPAACYAIVDERERTLTYHRVAYDAELAARKVREAGLPDVLALRLVRGI